MKNTRVIITAVTLVLTAALALCGCMYLIGEPPEETREYDPDEMTLLSVIEETPTSQSEMQKKFAVYGCEEKVENGERIFRLFTEEQIEESMQMRKDGVRRSLTFDEVVFLINDSVRIYREYDKIVMTDFGEHTIGTTRVEYHSNVEGDYTPRFSSSVSELVFNGIHGEYHSCGANQEIKFTTLTPYHGDFSEYTDYSSAVRTYDSMLLQIEKIISERLRILDTGTLCYCYSDGHSDYNCHLYGILFGVGINGEYSNYMAEFEKHRSNHPFLIGSREINNYEDTRSSYIYYIDAKYNIANRLFPTAELDAIRPRAAIHLSWTSGYNPRVPKRTVNIDFDRWNETVEITVLQMSLQLVEKKYSGTYAVDGDKLVLTLDSGTKLIIESDGEKRFKLADEYYKDEKWIKLDEELVFSFKNDDFRDSLRRMKTIPELFSK